MNGALKHINVRNASLCNQSVTAVTHVLLSNNPWVTAAWGAQRSTSSHLLALFCALWMLRADVPSFVFLFCHFSQVLSPSVTQTVRGSERLDFKKTESFDFRRRRTLPILLSMLSSPCLHLGQPMCQHASRRRWEIYEILKKFTNMKAWITEAHNYVAASNGFGSFTVLRLLTLLIGWHGC